MMFRITIARLINIPIMTEIMNFLCFRLSECLALISLSTTFFLFLHTRELNLQLVEERQRHSGEETSQEHFHSRDLSTAPDSLSDEYFEQVRHCNLISWLLAYRWLACSVTMTWVC